MPKNIASYTFLLVFKFFEYLRYILISFVKVHSLFFDKIIGVSSQFYLKKRGSDTGVSCELCETFKNTFFKDHY